jgi:hypothetical protein
LRVEGRCLSADPFASPASSVLAYGRTLRAARRWPRLVSTEIRWPSPLHPYLSVADFWLCGFHTSPTAESVDVDHYAPWSVVHAMVPQLRGAQTAVPSRTTRPGDAGRGHEQCAEPLKSSGTVCRELGMMRGAARSARASRSR